MKALFARFILSWLGSALSASVVVAILTSQPLNAQKTYIFKGTVEKVDAAAKTLTVSGENVDGWMAAMTMTYRLDQPEALTTLKQGDVITATVRDGDFSTLYGVRVTGQSLPVPKDALPAVSYACPSAGEESFVDDRPGRCPKSGAALQPVRLMTAYSCLRFQGYVREAPGRCPVDRSDLVPVTVGLYFTCTGDASVHDLNPGTCADGTARTRAYERRPHGDHNPRHGGLFFMAEDQWHHLEGTLVAPGIFRVYFYDDMTRPLAVTGLSARVARANDNAEEVGPAVPLTPGHTKDANTLEAPIGNVTFPINVKLRATLNGKEQAFDFTFATYSKEPGVG